MDLSDGLGDAVAQVAEASGVGARIDADAVPLHAAATRGPHAGDVVAWAVGAGDDYELLFTVSRRRRRAFHAAVQRAGVAMTRIGEVTRERGVRLRRHGSDEPLPGGYAHFA
jgi:thiamine-monophosphate kinase